MNKVIFLDIDGVLNTERWYRQMDKDTKKDRYGYPFDPESVLNLSKIISATGADIVISSSWKFWGLSAMKEMWEERSLPGEIIDITPNRMSDEMLLKVDFEDWSTMAGKGHEIKEWLQNNGEKVSAYVIIDDENDLLPEQQEHFVEISPETGITKEDTAAIIQLLSR